MQESRYLLGLLQYRTHEIFRYVSARAECKLNNWNGAGMNCGNIVEAPSRASLPPCLRPLAARPVII
jgi:hypothetical protein